MLLFSDFQHGPSESEIILDKNLFLINILFKGRSASSQDEMNMEGNYKDVCDAINYAMLSNENPKKYPPMGPGESFSYSGTQDGDSCIVSKPDEPGSFTVQDCDCSDPKNYDFYNKGRF